jgi:hypothetical protein
MTLIDHRLLNRILTEGSCLPLELDVVCNMFSSPIYENKDLTSLRGPLFQIDFPFWAFSFAK